MNFPHPSDDKSPLNPRESSSTLSDSSPPSPSIPYHSPPSACSIHSPTQASTAYTSYPLTHSSILSTAARPVISTPAQPGSSTLFPSRRKMPGINGSAEKQHTEHPVPSGIQSQLHTMRETAASHRSFLQDRLWSSIAINLVSVMERLDEQIVPAVSK